MSQQPAMLDAPLILPDVQIEYWAELYLARGDLARRGISFETLLRATPQVRAAGGLPAVLAAADLGELHRAAQLRACAREIARMERIGARCSNGTLVEKLRHHAHPRGNRDFIARQELTP